MKTPVQRLAAATLVATLAVSATAQWGPIQPPNQPPGREGALMAYDLPNSRMLMFGGNWSNELWALENGAWVQLQPATLPPARSRADMAVDSILGRVLLYGGDVGNQFADDETWAWDGTTWSQQVTTNSPGGLARHSMAFDSNRQVTVLFGGRRNSWVPVPEDETWEFSNGNWSQAMPAVRPPARVNGAMDFHSGLGAVMLFGGEDVQGMDLDDTWIYDGTIWTQINISGTRPPGRTNARMVHVLNRNLCVLFGGQELVNNTIRNDTWEHDGVDWRQVQTLGGIVPARHSLAMSHDIARDRIVAYGGKTQNSALPTDTWEYGAHWRRFGLGCPGSAGTPTFTGGNLPRLGLTCDATLSNLPTQSSIALVAVGLSKTQWQFGSLPAQLTNFGMPGCRAYTSADALTAIAVNAGVAQWSWPVPPSVVYLGQEFHLQGIALDPGANPGGATVTNAATMILGW